MFTDLSSVDGALWCAFVVVTIFLVALDLFAGRQRHAPMSLRAAIGWSAFYVALALAFGLVVWLVRGPDSAEEFYTAYVLEKTLSVDNLFLILLTFDHFRVPRGEQRRVLSWGILGAIVFRALLILLGAELIQSVHAIVYGLGAFLIYTGARVLLAKAGESSPESRWSVRVLRRWLPFVPRYEGGHFVVRAEGRRVGTMLLFVLLVVESADVLFALDSLPAAFAVTEDTFVIFTSNILALLGLRSLYFALERGLRRLRYLQAGLGVLLLLVGVKLVSSAWIHIPALYSLAATVGILGFTIVLSLTVDAWERRVAERQIGA
jgi:tellurite resistance protein TerC